MRQEIIQKIRERFTQHHFAETSCQDRNLYLYDDNLQHKTFLQSHISDDIKYLHLLNNQVDNVVSHICIDGDFIPFGRAK